MQNEWKNEKWSFLIGGRFDKHNLIDHLIFSPRANVRFNPTEDINLRLSYSSGFRAPQAFDEDLHVAAVGGEVAIIQLAEDLKEEKSKSISASADFYHRFGPVQLNLLVEGFYTDLSDVFFLQEKGHDDQGNLIMERRNKDGARVMGVNLEGKMAYAWLQLQAGATIQRSRYKEAVTWSETNPDLPAQKKCSVRRMCTVILPPPLLRSNVWLFLSLVLIREPCWFNIWPAIFRKTGKRKRLISLI